MVVFHLFIISTFPLAVPLEWNVLFAYATRLPVPRLPDLARLRASPTCPRRGWPCSIVAALLFFPILGNFRPDKVSFLPSMRQYAGNWASAMWAFAPGAEDKLNKVTRSATNQVDQFVAFGYEPQWAEITLQKTHRLAHHAQPGPRPVLGAAEDPARHRHPHRAGGASSSATR